MAGTPGAEFVPGLHTHRFHTIWRKGYERDRDAYAATQQHPGLVALYRTEEVEAVAVCGLTINICCFHTARDLRAAGFRVLIVEDAGAGLDVPSADLYQERARTEGLASGIEYVTTDAVLAVVTAT